MRSRRGCVFGITGHQNLSEGVRRIVKERIDDIVARVDESTGYSCLAAGADQVFAESLLEHGGSLVAVVPAHDYELTFDSSEGRLAFESLLNHAQEIIRMPFENASEAAYWAAGKEVAQRCDTLIAVWDGEPSGGLGGTADVVKYCREKGKDIIIVWPDGVRRS